mgnify:CR=1 FL=1
MQAAVAFEASGLFTNRQALADSLGVSKQAILYWYPSKWELMADCSLPLIRQEADAQHRMPQGPLGGTVRVGRRQAADLQDDAALIIQGIAPGTAVIDRATPANTTMAGERSRPISSGLSWGCGRRSPAASARSPWRRRGRSGRRRGRSIAGALGVRLGGLARAEVHGAEFFAGLRVHQGQLRGGKLIEEVFIATVLQ